MRFVKLLSILLFVVLMSGCAPGLNPTERREYVAMKQAGVLVKDKNPTTGAVLGILPGGGSFYAREPGFGSINLLFWPLSVLWDPFNGYEGSVAINYAATKNDLKRQREKELALLDVRLKVGEVDAKGYAFEKIKIAQKYDY